jgi:phenylpropionate dioxygenase-like ring-hydroxylating dioxygenase large terminal subunit
LAQTSQNDETGSAYGRPPQTHDAELTEVGPGTPCGELMRRYWQPVELSERLGVRPMSIRVLGEDLILFRDLQGRAGLITPRCIHRGAPMSFAKVEDGGIRCPYHGWLFDTEGRCVDQPCEKDRPEFRARTRQPWYPVEERYGLVFAYLGPPGKQPVLPKWAPFEDISPDEKIVPDAASFSVGGDETAELIPWNWLQDWENTMDPFHVVILHSSFSGPQFNPKMAIMPDVVWDHTPLGLQYLAHRKMPDGRKMDRITHVMFPNLRSVPNIQLSHGVAESMGWLVPTDDTHHRTFHITRMPLDHEGVPMVTAPVLEKKWSDMTDDERWMTPGDWEIQKGQGPITLHSEEQLASSDRGVVMLRRLLREQIGLVQLGGDPIGVHFDAAAPAYHIGAGNFYQETMAAEEA